MKRIQLMLLPAMLCLSQIVCAQSAQPDTLFDLSVDKPAFVTYHPTLLFDEAHNNYHKASGTYKPFVKLAINDGLTVQVNTTPFTAASLPKGAVLVIANAKGAQGQAQSAAFTQAECKAVKKWVKHGGSLLLITDHYPFGDAADLMAREFDVDFQKGLMVDTLYYDKPSRDESQIVYSRENHLLGDHEITTGISKVIAFTGQSISLRGKFISLLSASNCAADYTAEIKMEKKNEDTRTTVNYVNMQPATGRSQCIAFQYGKGRIVVTGEAAMLSAQVNRQGKPLGMNYPGTDNKQFTLNILRWLVNESKAL